MSAHFTLHELRCKDGTEVPADLLGNAHAVTSQAEIIRSADGRPQEVVSAYRTDAYNRKVGGAPDSRHKKCLALDMRPIIKVAGVRVPWLLVAGKKRIIAEYHERIVRMAQEDDLKLVGGIGLYPGRWVHIDVRPRPDGRIARWVGRGIGSEVV